MSEVPDVGRRDEEAECYVCGATPATFSAPLGKTLCNRCESSAEMGDDARADLKHDEDR